MAESKDGLNEGGDAPKPAAHGGHHGSMLVIIVGLVVMLVAPAASWLVVKSMTGPHEPKEPPKKEEEAPTVTVAVEPLVVNIAGTRMNRVLRIAPHLILSDARLQEVITPLMPMIKDRIMTAASRRTLAELETPEDREALKRDIATEINNLVREKNSGTVLDVVFSDFLIQ